VLKIAKVPLQISSKHSKTFLAQKILNNSLFPSATAATLGGTFWQKVSAREITEPLRKIKTRINDLR